MNLPPDLQQHRICEGGVGNWEDRFFETEGALNIEGMGALLALDRVDVARILIGAIATASEETMCAGWMADVEKDAWHWVIGEPCIFDGTRSPDPALLTAMRVLHDRLDGWVIVDYASEYFVIVDTDTMRGYAP